MKQPTSPWLGGWLHNLLGVFWVAGVNPLEELGLVHMILKSGALGIVKSDILIKSKE